MGSEVSSSDPLRIGVVGCGNISGIYFKNLPSFGSVEVVACADLRPELSAAIAADNPSIRALTTDALLNDSEIDIVLNLTQPGFHFELMKAGIEAKKHVYTEKPLSIRFEDSQRLLALADRGWRANWMRARHLSRSRDSDLSGVDRFRDDWRPGCRHRVLHHTGSRTLASRTRVLLQGRRWPDARHGPLLPHRPGEPSWSCYFGLG